MAGDPYSILGVARAASQDEIRKSFRKQAKTLHPDVNPGDAAAEKKFKEISAAYELLRDKEKRARYDRGEIGADGSERAQQPYSREYARAGGEGPYYSTGEFSGAGEAEDIFSQFFSRGSRGGGRGGVFRMRGEDQSFSMNVPFLDAVNGTTTQIKLSHGPSLDVRIPPGTRDGQTLRLKGKGGAGRGGAAPGDALIEIHVMPHAFFERDGDDIRLDLPITLSEAVLGAKVNVPTPKGPVAVSVPANASGGKVLRLKGRGLAKRGGGEGDLYATVRIVLPETPDAELRQFIESWDGDANQKPRRKMGV